MKNTLILRRFSVLHPRRNLAASFESRSIKIFFAVPIPFLLSTLPRRSGGQVRQADDRVQVELVEELLLDCRLCPLRSEHESVRHDDGGTPAFLQPVHDDGHEEVGGLAGAEIGREVHLHAVLLAAAVRRIHHDDVELVLRLVGAHVALERIAVVDARRIDVVEKHVRHAQEVRQRLLLDAEDGLVEESAVTDALHLWLQHLQGRGQEPTRTTGEVRDMLAQFRREHLDDEIRVGTGRIELAGRSGGLQFLQNRLVDFAEGVAILVFVEVDLVDDLTGGKGDNRHLTVVTSLFKDALPVVASFCYVHFKAIIYVYITQYAIYRFIV